MSKKILITDDSLYMRTLFKDLLVKEGHIVVGEAKNGLEAVQLYQELLPDLVTMDITMPEMNGLEATKKIMEIDSKANIIMVSAIGQQEIIKEAIKAGAREFIVKPFSKDQVMEAISKIKAS